MRPLSFLLPLMLLAAMAVWIGGLLLSGRDPHALPSALIDHAVPEFELPTLDGSDTLSSDELKGRVALVNVFASWCVPCRVEHPVLMKLAERGIPIYGIDYKDPPDQAKAFLAELGSPYEKIGVDRDGRVGIDWGVYGVPETFVIDKAGRIRYRHPGPLTLVDTEIRPLLAELAK